MLPQYQGSFDEGVLECPRIPGSQWLLRSEEAGWWRSRGKPERIRRTGWACTAHPWAQLHNSRSRVVLGHMGLQLRVSGEIVDGCEAELGVRGYAESPPRFRSSSFEIDINRSGACAIVCTRRSVLTWLSVLTNLIPPKDGER